MPTWLRECKVTATYKIRYTSVSCYDVVKSLSASTGGQRWTPSEAARKDPKLYRQEIEQSIGLHGFMLFQVTDHGYILHHLSAESEYKPSFRMAVGNPLMAECIQRIDSSTALHMPLEMLIEETPLHITDRRSGAVREFTGTMVSYMLPSSLIAPKEKASRMAKTDFDCLLRAARNFDTMFETLIKDICSPNAVTRANLRGATLPAVSSSNDLASMITMDKLEDPTLAIDWVETATSRSSSIWTLPKTPDDSEAAKSEEIDLSSSVEHISSVLKEHALRRRSRQGEHGKTGDGGQGGDLVSISEDSTS